LNPPLALQKMILKKKLLGTMYHIQTTNSHKQPKHTPKNLKTHKTQTQESQKAQKIDLQYTKSTNLKFGL
jgi:hypothetical protein